MTLILTCQTSNMSTSTSRAEHITDKRLLTHFLSHSLRYVEAVKPLITTEDVIKNIILGLKDT